MSDPNPYEPPRELEPLTKGQVVKRGIGVALILLATPPAMVIAVAVSCTTDAFATTPMLVFSFPLIVLTILMGWAAILDRRKRDDSTRTSSRLGIFLSTPLLVAIAAGIGLALAIPVFFAVGEGSTWFHALPILSTFWLPPSAVLLVMLWLAWRAG